MMAVPLLLIAVFGLATTEVCCQFPENFGNPPPLPAEGVGLYQGLRNRTIPNYAMIAARDFSDRDAGIKPLGFLGADDGINDGLWCQGTNNGNDIGSWQLPNGSAVPADFDAVPIHMANAPGQVGLLRAMGINIFPYQGMYTCTILDEDGVNQTLVVWAAGNDAYDGNPVPNPNITAVSFIPSTKPRDTDPSELILSFSVNIAPPTYVTCQVNTTPVDVAILSREVTAAEYETESGSITSAPVTNVSVTLRIRQAGEYQCTVSVFRASGSNLTNSTTEPINIKVTGTPTDLTAVKTGYNTVQLSWSTPASNIPPVAGYEVFYAVSGRPSTQSGANATNTSATLSGLLLGNLYDFFVVAYSDMGNTLPSSRSNNDSIYLAIPQLTGSLNATSTMNSVMLSWTNPTPDFPPTRYHLNSVCTLLCNVSFSYTNSNSTSSLTANITGLLPSSECEITLTAEYDGVRTNGLMTNATTLSQAPPSAPVNLSLQAINNNSVMVTWDVLPCSELNGPPSEYILQHTADSIAPANSIVSAKITTTYQLTGLIACTNYTLKIAARNNAGTSDFSLSESVITNGTVGPGPVSFITSTKTYTNITISWTAPSNENGVIVQYLINITYSETTLMANTTKTTFLLTPLSPATTVVFTLKAVSICGIAGAIQSIMESTNPIPVTSSFRTDIINSTSVNASWTPVDNSYLDHYTVYYYPSSTQNGRKKRQSNEQMAVFPAGSSFGVIGGLEEEQDYLFSLAVTFDIDGQVFEGMRTDPAPPGVEVTQPPVTEPTTSPDKPTDMTTTQGETQLPTGSSNAAAIAGGVVGVLIIVIIIIVAVIVVVLVMRRHTTSKLYEVQKQPQTVHFSKSPEKEDEVKLTTVPVIESFPGTMTAEEGQRVEFKVSVRGTPSSSYQWYHDDQLVEEDYAHEVTEEGSLILVTAEQKHSGTYKLMAKNLAGVAEKSLTLIIIKEEGDEDTVPMAVNGVPVSLPVQLSHDAIPVADFGQYVADHHADNNRGFRSLYSSLAGREGEHPVTIAITPTNKPLNRFANITVYDDNRILLKPIMGRSDCKGDYINASYMDGYSLHNQYIATQGPMSKTLVDFWRLVWQEKPQTIVMVTNLKEEKKVKCQQYWPETGSQNYGPFRVTLTDQEMYTDYTIRLLQVELPGSSEYPHRVSQFHFISWPDHGVPDYATPILTLHRQVKQRHKSKRGPLLVHCSAGIGRTGTFIAIDMALEKVEKENLVDISNIIIKMRQQRMKMVQTLDQFIFICDAILESITCGDTQIPASDLRLTLSKLRSVDPSTGKTGFQHRFDVLTQVTPNPAEVKHNIAFQYPDQNRTLEFAPPDKHRVPLKGSSHDYINATFVNGYKQKKAFIIAQSPMENTCRDFWKMVFERGCGVIIMLCETQENGKETCAQYWPSVGETKAFGEVGEFFVEIQGEVDYPGFVERTLSVVDHKENGKPHKVLQYQITNWEYTGRCSNLQTIVSVQEEMYKVQRRTGNNPVVVHCSDTVSRSGMFCAIATAIDRCKTEGLVDVFQVIKAQRIQKPGLVPDVAHYELVFDAILVFLDSFETYINFQ